MNPYYEDDLVQLWHGDCLDILATLPDSSVHAVCTDPPYGLEFMGREWDGADGFRRSLNAADAGRDNAFGRASRTSPEYRAGTTFQEWCERWAAECLRVLKPGGHMLAFGGSRTWHRLAVAVEDAGFEIRDSIAWLYGSGFPKSLDVSKAIDKAAGAEREVVGPGRYATRGRSNNLPAVGWSDEANKRLGPSAESLETAPATPDAERWQGWGTALKPAFEPIVVARKPLTGTVAGNVLAHGTGALNVDGCRVPGDEDGSRNRPASRLGSADTYAQDEWTRTAVVQRQDTTGKGRWPTNVLLDDTQAAELDRQSGVTRDGIATNRNRGDERPMTVAGAPRKVLHEDVGYGGQGGASRFFPTFRYEAKAPTRERPFYTAEDGSRVAHPTTKPLDLMRWLVRLVTPPGGTVLEPFAGSGTTAEACVIEGFPCIVIEREADYLPLIKARLTKPLEPVLDLGALS